jgi:hypothetical protein
LLKRNRRVEIWVDPKSKTPARTAFA